MALLISVDGTRPVKANTVVVYRDDVPVAAACAIDADNVMYADGIRDPEFETLLQTIGVRTDKRPVAGPTIRGNM